MQSLDVERVCDAERSELQRRLDHSAIRFESPMVRASLLGALLLFGPLIVPIFVCDSGAGVAVADQASQVSERRVDAAEPNDTEDTRREGAAFEALGAGGEEVFPPIDDRPRPIGLHVPDWFKPSFLDLSEDLDEALAKGKQGLVVYFGMDDCPYCEALFERNFSQPDIETYFREHFDVIALDVLGAREITTVDGRRMTEREYSIELNLNFTPSLLFIDASREPVFAVRGYYPPRRFRAALEFVIDRHFEERRFSEFLALADPPPKFDLDDLNEQDFFASGPHRLDRRAAPASRPLLVFFERRACHACDVLHSETILDQRVRDSLALFDVIQLDLDGDTPVLTPDGQRLRSREWGEQLGIHWAPTLVFFDESGVERIRIDSVVGINRLHNVMQYVLTRGYETEPTYERWRAAPL